MTDITTHRWTASDGVDLAWHETINHARDWLGLSMATDEPQEAVRRFVEKRGRE